MVGCYVDVVVLYCVVFVIDVGWLLLCNNFVIVLCLLGVGCVEEIVLFDVVV